MTNARYAARAQSTNAETTVSSSATPRAISAAGNVPRRSKATAALSAMKMTVHSIGANTTLYTSGCKTMAKEKDTLSQSEEHNARGIELADRGWLDEAIKEFKKAIELDPNSAHAHDNLATVHAEKKNYRDALAEYLTALRLEPDSATAHYNLACFLSTHGPD